MRKKIINGMVMFLMLLLLVGCGVSQEDKEAAEKLNELIEKDTTTAVVIVTQYSQLSDVQKKLVNKHEDIEAIIDIVDKIRNIEGVPSQSIYDEICTKYNALTDSQKALLKADFIEKYQDVDLNLLRNLTERISDVDDKTSFNTIVGIKNEYDNLTKRQQNLVNISALDKYFKLSNEEEAALAGAKNIQSVMKDPASLTFSEITVKNDLSQMGFYWVKYKYSANNSFGGAKSSVACFGINSEYEDPFWKLALVTGVEKRLNDTTSLIEYNNSTASIVDIDTDKIIYYMNN